MEMRRGKCLPQQQHDRRNDCDLAQEIFVSMFAAEVH